MTADPEVAEPIAIVGMACVFPGARDLAQFWSNIVRGVDATGEVPRSRWDPGAFGLPAVRAGCIDGLTEFDPLEHGIMPAAVAEGDPEQFLVAGVVLRALQDAAAAAAGGGGPGSPGGLALPDEVRGRSELVIGRGGYLGNGIEHLHLRMEVVDQMAALFERLAPGLPPQAAAELRRLLNEATPPLTAESVAAALPNLNAGRVMNRLDLRGAGYTVDAACASALFAVDAAVRSLRGRRSDLGIAAAVHINQKPSIWLAFHTLGVLSEGGRSRPFDAAADGLVMGEGVGAVVLKRLEDAKRDGDRVYAAIRAVGTSSDGRSSGLLTPSVAGELLAVRRAFEEAGIDPGTVTLIEGHGTATEVGDRTEIAALRQALGDRPWPAVALGSVKSMIGHAMPAAGMAGLIKTALALHHRTLPPTVNVDEPHPDLAGSALYPITVTAPWISPPGVLRRAGVDAFGFGGANAHAILEEVAHGPSWSSLTPRSHELVLLTAGSRDELLHQIDRWRAALGELGDGRLADVAFTCSVASSLADPVRLAIVASDLGDLGGKLDRARAQLEAGGESWTLDEGIFLGAGPPVGKTAVVVPGIGFPGLAGGFARRLGELCLQFPAARELLDLADTLILEDELPYPLHHQLFAPPLLDSRRLAQIENELSWSARTPTAFVMTNLAMWSVLDRLGLRPDALVGFSLGETVALIAAGAFDTRAVARDLMAEVRRLVGTMPVASEEDSLWAMVAAPAAAVEMAIDRFGSRVSLAMDVAPGQTFIAGEATAARAVLQQLAEQGYWSQELPQLPMLRPFFAVHTPRMAKAARRFKSLVGRFLVHPPSLPVYCGSTGRPYSSDPRAMLDELAESVTGTVRIRDAISAMYDDGFRTFVQLGAGGKLITNIHNTLGQRPHAALAMDLDTRGGYEQLLHLLGRLAALGVGFAPGELYRHRRCAKLGTGARIDAAEGGRVLSLAPPRLELDGAGVARLRALLADEDPDGVVSAAVARPDQQPAESQESGPVALVDRLHRLMLRQEAAEQAVLASMVELQQGLLSALAGAQASPASPTPGSPVVPLPFLREVVRLDPGRELSARVVLDLDVHRFLGHHTFVNLPDGLKPPEERLPTLPLTFGLELLAEAAAALVPSLEIVALHDVTASRFIQLESARTLTLEIAARRTAEQEVVVEVRTAGAERPSLVGGVTLGRGLPPPPPPLEPTLDQACPHTAEEFYRVGPLFHGPLLRVVTALGEMGPGGVSGEVTVTDPAGWFSSPRERQPLLDPVLLDGLAQVAGYRAWLDGRLVLPVSLERIERYAPLPPPGERVRATVALAPLDGRQVEIRIDAHDAAGRPLLRIDGLRSWRVFCPPSLLELNHRPNDLAVAAPWDGLPECRCYRVRRDDLGDLGPDWVARLYLGGEEWVRYRTERRLDWLLGRIAAKDAVRAHLARAGAPMRHPIEVIIANRDTGAPEVAAPSDDRPAGLSIAHLEDEAIAVVADSPGIGVDLVAVAPRSRELVATAFSEGECAVLGGSEVAIARAWAAKEAVAKALGWGLEGIARLTVRTIAEDGVVAVEVAGWTGSCRVPTWLDRDRVIAIAMAPVAEQGDG